MRTEKNRQNGEENKMLPQVTFEISIEHPSGYTYLNLELRGRNKSWGSIKQKSPYM